MSHWARTDKALLAAILAGLFCGFSGILRPVDDLARGLRNLTHMQPASGKIVVVLIDKDSKKAEGSWPWPRARIASLVDRIDEARAERVYFSHVMEGDQPGNRALAESFASLPQRPVIAYGFDIDPATGTRVAMQPAQQLEKVADIAGGGLYSDAFSQVSEVPLAYAVDGRAFPGLASHLAGRLGSDEANARIDYSIDANSIPTITASEVMAGRAGNRLLGKRVLISAADRVLPMQRGVHPQSFAYVLGAETLMTGTPKDFGWMRALGVAVLLSLLISFGRRSTASCALVAAGTSILVLPFVLDAHLMFHAYGPGAVTVAVTASVRLWRSFRRRDSTSNVLTGLPNLTAFKARASEDCAIIAAKIGNYAELVSAVPAMEAELTQEIARRFNVGAEGPLYHGDEGVFAWTVSRLQPREIGDHLDALHSFFAKPVTVGKVQVDVTPVFGIETSVEESFARRLAGALVAAEGARKTGQRWQFYDPARQDELEWNISMLGQLDQAIEEGEVWVAFQPKLDLATGRIVGAEALARWTHPERGAIPPETFVRSAEQAGRIDRLTYFVLDKALEFVADGQRSGHDLSVAVNLSTLMAEHSDLTAKVRAALRRYKVPAEKLTLEITETAANTVDKLTASVAGLKGLGVKVSIDDYGTGHCTLEYLKTIAADELKIDRSFVTAIDHNRSDAVLVRATIQLAHQLGLTVVAEGVETESALQILIGLGCDQAQGFHISRPMPAEDVLASLDDRNRQVAA